MITQTEKINRLLNQILKINAKKLLSLKEYADNWFLFKIAMKESNLTGCFKYLSFEDWYLLQIAMKETNLTERFKYFSFQDGLILQHVIENKNQMINQYSME